MGILKDNMLRGLVGPLVFSVIKNRQIVKKKVARGKLRQSKGTKAAANTFGMASSLGSYVRLVHKNGIRSLHDPGMALRMTNTLNHILMPCRDRKNKLFIFKPDSFDQLRGFDYNNVSPLNKSLLINPVINYTEDMLTVAFPEGLVANSLKFPVESYGCELTVSVSLFQLAEGLMCRRPQEQYFTIEKRQHLFDGQVFKFDVPSGCLYIVSLFLKYYTPYKNLLTLVNTKKFSPGGIIETMITPGVFMNDKNYKWEVMGQLKFPSLQDR